MLGETHLLEPLIVSTNQVSPSQKIANQHYQPSNSRCVAFNQAKTCDRMFWR
ncbi:hypothetical protein NIES4101_76930 [Calothrix sp. NIES-4101]|nr:hypothetical protein NIES4101_76930 [Calothrix sp. NIES-4101]